MNKKCTNPACRKVFSTLNFYGGCPHCGKEYPQLVSKRKLGQFRAVRILDFNGYKVKAVKAVRKVLKNSLKEAKAAVDHTPDTIYFLKPKHADQLCAELAALGGTWSVKNAAKRSSEHFQYPD